MQALSSSKILKNWSSIANTGKILIFILKKKDKQLKDIILSNNKNWYSCVDVNI